MSAPSPPGEGYYDLGIKLENATAPPPGAVALRVRSVHMAGIHDRMNKLDVIAACPVFHACGVVRSQVVNAQAAAFFARGFLVAAFGAGSCATTRGLRPKPIFFASS